MKRLVPWIITVTLLVGAWLAIYWTPTEADITAPFVVKAELGKPAVGRGLTVTINAVHVSKGIFIPAEPDDGNEYTFEEERWAADGSWVVLDLDAAANLTQLGSTIQRAVLVIDGRTYWAEERMPSLADSVSLVPGVPLRGNFAFQVPPETLQSTGKIQISLAFNEIADSMIELEIDLGSLPIEDSVEIVPTDWTNR